MGSRKFSQENEKIEVPDNRRRHRKNSGHITSSIEQQQRTMLKTAHMQGVK